MINLFDSNLVLKCILLSLISIAGYLPIPNPKPIQCDVYYIALLSYSTRAENEINQFSFVHFPFASCSILYSDLYKLFLPSILVRQPLPCSQPHPHQSHSNGRSSSPHMYHIDGIVKSMYVRDNANCEAKKRKKTLGGCFVNFALL